MTIQPNAFMSFVIACLTKSSSIRSTVFEAVFSFKSSKLRTVLLLETKELMDSKSFRMASGSKSKNRLPFKKV